MEPGSGSCSGRGSNIEKLLSEPLLASDSNCRDDGGDDDNHTRQHQGGLEALGQRQHQQQQNHQQQHHGRYQQQQQQQQRIEQLEIETSSSRTINGKAGSSNGSTAAVTSIYNTASNTENIDNCNNDNNETNITFKLLLFFRIQWITPAVYLIRLYPVSFHHYYHFDYIAQVWFLTLITNFVLLMIGMYWCFGGCCCCCCSCSSAGAQPSPLPQQQQPIQVQLQYQRDLMPFILFSLLPLPYFIWYLLILNDIGQDYFVVMFVIFGVLLCVLGVVLFHCKKQSLFDDTHFGGQDHDHQDSITRSTTNERQLYAIWNSCTSCLVRLYCCCNCLQDIYHLEQEYFEYLQTIENDELERLERQYQLVESQVMNNGRATAGRQTDGTGNVHDDHTAMSIATMNMTASSSVPRYYLLVLSCLCIVPILTFLGLSPVRFFFPFY